MPGSVNFEDSGYTPSNDTYLTKFYKTTEVVIGILEETTNLNLTTQSLPMWDGQSTYPLDEDAIRSVEVYEDSDNDGLLNRMIPSVYVGRDPFPALEDMIPETAYLRLDGGAIKVQATQLLSNDCTIIVVTD